MQKPEGWKQDNKRHWEAKVFGKASPGKNSMKPKYPPTSGKTVNPIGRRAIEMSYIKGVSERMNRNYFSEGATRFFHTRYPKWGYSYDGSKKIFFIASDQMDYDSPRNYTLRYTDEDTGSTESVGAFNELTKREAEKLMNIVGKAKVIDTDARNDNIIAWFGGSGIHVYNKYGKEIGFWNHGGYESQELSAEEMEKHIRYRVYEVPEDSEDSYLNIIE
jgi:hypothetical protein